MFLASLLIGLREGLEASLIIGILIAYLGKLGRREAIRHMWSGVAIAVVLTAVIGAVSTFGRSRLSFTTQEIIGGSMSILAVIMITGMIFWMMSAGKKMKVALEGDIEKVRARRMSVGFAVFAVAFVSVAREGIETTIILWGWVNDPLAITGALMGVVVAIALGWALFKGLVRFNMGAFFTWSGAALIVVAGGVLAYGIHDLQEAAVLPGPFSGAPITPTHPRTGEVLTGFFTYPFWGAAFPFGWAFNVSDVIDPSGVLATFLKGTVGFVPQMSWLEVLAWFVYMALVIPRFIRRAHENKHTTSAKTATASAHEDPRKRPVTDTSGNNPQPAPTP